MKFIQASNSYKRVLQAAKKIKIKTKTKKKAKESIKQKYLNHFLET